MRHWPVASWTSGIASVAGPSRGGFRPDNRHVPIVVWGAGIDADVVDEPVATNQIAPTILSLLGLKPHALQAVQAEGTRRLPQLR